MLLSNWTLTANGLFLIAFLFLWVAVLVFHANGRFRNLTMWVPVLEGPLILIVGLVALWITALVWIYLVLLAIAFLGGLIGFGYHFRGALRVQGPPGLTIPKMARIPIFLPPAWAALSAIGFCAAYRLL